MLAVHSFRCTARNFGAMNRGVAVAVRSQPKHLDRSIHVSFLRSHASSAAAVSMMRASTSTFPLMLARNPALHRSRCWYTSQVLQQATKSKPLPKQPIATKPAEQSKNRQRFVRFIWYARMARIPFLIGAVYSLGYQQGTVDTVRNPAKLQQGLFETAMMQMGVVDGGEVDVISEAELMTEQKHRQRVLQRVGWTLKSTLTRVGWTSTTSNQDGKEEQLLTAAAVLPPTTERHKYRDQTEQLSRIGREILRAARKLVEEELENAVKALSDNLSDDTFQSMTDAQKHHYIHSDEKVAMWVKAQQRLEGEKLNGIYNWQYIVIGTSIPNAFVSEMLPQRFFVTTGLLKLFVANDDELAMVLGHELSHLLLGHMSEQNAVDFMLRGLEIFLLAVDPTEGLLSLGVAAFLANAREALTAAQSREHESEADELGCRLAAMACYDTTIGAGVFDKMHKFDVEHDVPNNSIMATHPPSDERYAALKELARDENMERYSYCSGMKTRIQRALTQRE